VEQKVCGPLLPYFLSHFPTPPTPPPTSSTQAPTSLILPPPTPRPSPCHLPIMLHSTPTPPTRHSTSGDGSRLRYSSTGDGAPRSPALSLTLASLWEIRRRRWIMWTGCRRRSQRDFSQRCLHQQPHKRRLPPNGCLLHIRIRICPPPPHRIPCFMCGGSSSNGDRTGARGDLSTAAVAAAAAAAAAARGKEEDGKRPALSLTRTLL
jgi:hypothetical protein